MDLFAWTQLPTEEFRPDLVTNEVSPLWIPDSQSSAWQWGGGEHCAQNYIGHHVPPVPPLPFTDTTTTSSPESYKSSDSYRASSFDGSHFDSSPTDSIVEYDIPGDAKPAGRPRCPVSTGRDPNENRIQRRRTQNRNSQRVYRQRRIEERNEFEARATTAEATSEKLQKRVGELEVEVAELTEKCKDLQEENVSLRTSSSAGR